MPLIFDPMGINLQPTLQDELVLLKPLCLEHFDALYEVAKDPLIWEQHPSGDRYKKEVYADFFADSINSQGALIVFDKCTGEIIGSTRFKKVSDEKNAIEIGWSFLSRDKWGGLYNQAMKCLMIEYAFDYVENVVFYIGKDNVRSQKAVEKIGGRKIFEPHLKHLIKKSEINWTYLIRRKDWKNNKL